jgi:large conductance mechanosensitive channel
VLKDFQQFLARGNVIDMAVGIIVGLAFGQVVSGLVTDIGMPPVGLLLPRVNFSNLFINLSSTHYATYAAAEAAGAPIMAWGAFITTVIGFLLVSLGIFLIVRQRSRLQKPAPAATKTCPYCVGTVPLAATRCPQCTSALEA